MFGINMPQTPAEAGKIYTNAVRKSSAITLPIAAVRINNAMQSGNAVNVVKATGVSAVDVATCGGVTTVQIIGWGIGVIKNMLAARKAAQPAAQPAPAAAPAVPETKVHAPKKAEKKQETVAEAHAS